MSSSTITYAGWYRPGRRQPWRKVVENAATPDDAWDGLLDQPPGDKCVVPEGYHPHDEAPRGTCG
jgi:hypothetical protein